MRYKIDDKEDEYFSLLYEEWIDMLDNLDTKDNKKRYSAYDKYKASTIKKYHNEYLDRMLTLGYLTIWKNLGLSRICLGKPLPITVGFRFIAFYERRL